MTTHTNSHHGREVDRLLRWTIACCLPACALFVGSGRTTLAAPPAVDFNRDIRPILSENCFYCHGQDVNKRQAELRLDVREVAVEAGAIVPKELPASELIERINSLTGKSSCRRRSRTAGCRPSRKRFWSAGSTKGRITRRTGRLLPPRARINPRSDAATGFAIRSTGSYSTSSKPRVSRHRPKPTGRP